MAPQPLPQEHLERSFHDLEGIIDTMNCGLIIRHLDRTIAFANQRALDWLGYAEEELVGQSLLAILPPEIHELALGEMKATEEGDVRGRLTVIMRKDSTTFPALLLPQRILSPEGEPVGTSAVLIELGTIQTAKQAGYSSENHIRERLDRIAMEIQSISLSAAIPSGEPLPLEHPDLEGLTPREREVLQLLVSGERVPAIAQSLFISQHTVRNHLKSIYRKVDVNTQSELIQRIRALGQSGSE